MQRSPILHALIAMLALFSLSFVFLDPDFVNDVLDSFTMAAGIFVLIRYGKQIYLSMLEPKPDGSQCLIVSIGLIAFSVSLLRGLREFGLELGIINYVWVKYAFAMVTVVMVFGLFLKVIAPPIPFARFEVVLRPWVAFSLSIISGVFLSILVMGIRKLT